MFVSILSPLLAGCSSMPAGVSFTHLAEQISLKKQGWKLQNWPVNALSLSHHPAIRQVKLLL
jgi:hypothetical protein